MMLFLRAFLFVSLACNLTAHASEVTEPSYKEAEKKFYSALGKAKDETLVGNWKITSVATANPEVHDFLPTPAGLYPKGVHNEDGSLRTQLKIRRASLSETPSLTHDPALDLRISGIGRADVQQGPRLLRYSSEDNLVQFEVYGYVSGKPVNTGFSFDCRYVASILINDDRMICQVSLELDPAEEFAPIVRQFSHKPLAYYEYRKQNSKH